MGIQDLIARHYTDQVYVFYLIPLNPGSSYLCPYFKGGKIGTQLALDYLAVR